MQVKYKSDLYASYVQIAIPPNLDRTQYAFQMLQRNSIQGVLNVEERVEEGEGWLYLNVTGKVNLRQEFKEREMQLEEMTSIFRQLVTMIEELRNYLLADKLVLLDPEFIYQDVETERIFAAVLPWEEGEGNGLRGLAEFFLEKIDPKDEHGINMAYLFYKQQSTPQFSLYQFLSALERENIAKRQKQKERAEMDEPKGDDLDEPEICFWEKEEEKKTKQKHTLRDFFSRLFHPKKEINPKYDLSAAGKQELEAGSETVFFEPEKACLSLQWKEKGRQKKVVLEQLPMTIGKLKGEASVVIEDRSISRIHCRFLEHEGRIALMDLNSTNGTILNGMRLKSGEMIGIAKNDEILLGKVRIVVS